VTLAAIAFRGGDALPTSSEALTVYCGAVFQALSIFVLFPYTPLRLAFSRPITPLVPLGKPRMGDIASVVFMPPKLQYEQHCIATASLKVSTSQNRNKKIVNRVEKWRPFTV
jgi:hypothetical protein